GGLASQAQPTTSIDLGVTLDSNAATYNAGVAFDPNNAATYQYKAEANIYDSLGQQHAVSVYYVKEANNTWSWNAGVDGADVAGGIPGQQVILGNTATNFNTTNPALTLPLPAGTEISGNATFDQAVTINGTNILAGQTVSAALGNSVVIATSAFPAGTNVSAGNVLTAPASNQLTFGSQGELVTEVGPGINFPWNSAAVSTINFNFGDATTNDQQAILGNGLSGTVQMAGTFATRQIVRDGYSSGFLDKLETDSTGRVFGVFTNGQRRSLYQVALAKFPNDAVLNHVGNNLQQETIASGSPILEKPGNGGMGTITPYGLEQSNVDLAGEFVKLIIVQRGYEANSKTISTTDQMLSSLMQLKR
ncbi:MAG: flagellar hook-basal body complex protein, partial [Ghiorsea sp.]|nr:flagellar hook-basal body complex protein [Ghiorsea sp.]